MKGSFLIVFAATAVIGSSAEIFPGCEYSPVSFNRVGEYGAYVRRPRDNCVQIVIRPQRQRLMGLPRRTTPPTFMNDCCFGAGGLDHSSYPLGAGEDIFRDPNVDGLCRPSLPCGKSVYSTASAYAEPERIYSGASPITAGEGFFPTAPGIPGKSPFHDTTALTSCDEPIFPNPSSIRAKRMYSGMSGIFDRGVGVYRGPSFL